MAITTHNIHTIPVQLLDTVHQHTQQQPLKIQHNNMIIQMLQQLMAI